MSLELKIESLTAAINTLIEAIGKQNATVIVPASAAVPVAVPVAAPVHVPAVVAAPVAAPVAVAAPVMPAMPTFNIPVAAVAPTGAPFSDPKGLIEFVMTSYKNLGPAKGAGIQGVLTGLGYQNINDVKAEHYAALFSGIEALKG